jgi:hypothetical protein
MEQKLIGFLPCTACEVEGSGGRVSIYKIVDKKDKNYGRYTGCCKNCGWEGMLIEDYNPKSDPEFERVRFEY